MKGQGAIARWFRVAAIVMFGLGFGGSGFVRDAAAQTDGPPPQVLTLDQDRLYAESLYGKAMEAKAQTNSQELASENRRIEAELATEEADLTNKRATMTAADFQTMADAFDAKVEKLRADQAAKVDVLKAQRDSGRKTFLRAAVPVLADMMRQMGAFVIINHDALFLSFDSIDVTDRAIKAVDVTLGDGSALPTGPRLAPVTPVTLQGDAMSLGSTTSGNANSGNANSGNANSGNANSGNANSGNATAGNGDAAPPDATPQTAPAP